MIKDTRLKAIRDLKEDFKVNNILRAWYDIHELLESDFIPTDYVDVYEEHVSSYSKSMIDGWTSHTEKIKYYTFHVEMVKKVNNKIVSKWVKIELDEVHLLLKLHEILNTYS